MNKYFENAQRLIEQAIVDIPGRYNFTGKENKDPIDCFNPSALDSSISKLIEARAEMAIGRYLDSEVKRAINDLIKNDDDDYVVHMCPSKTQAGIMPCCGRTPFEVPILDRMTIDQKLVTCKGEEG